MVKRTDKQLLAVGYIRVSTNGQVENGVSLPAQEAKIRAWAEANDATLLEVYRDEGMSGSKADRPGLEQAIKRVTDERAALVIYSLSRFSRSTRDTLRITDTLHKAGADLVSLSERIDTTTAAGKMVFRMLAVLNEFERDQISDRTKSALAYLKSQGKKTGGLVPYGYTADETGALTKDPTEQAIIRKIIHQYGDGWSFTRIARALNGEGTLTKYGKTWYAQTIKNIIKDNPKNPKK